MNKKIKNNLEQFNIDINHYKDTFTAIVQKISEMPEGCDERHCLFKQLNDETTAMSHNVMAIISDYFKKQES